MFEDEHPLEGGRCGSASHCETLSIAAASLCHQITLSQPPIAFTCSISLCAVFPLRTSPTGKILPTRTRTRRNPYPCTWVRVSRSCGYGFLFTGFTYYSNITLETYLIKHNLYIAMVKK